MLSAELRGAALVAGGGRGIGADIARELARAMDVAVTGRTAEEVHAVAEEIGGRALTGDVFEARGRRALVRRGRRGRPARERRGRLRRGSARGRRRVVAHVRGERAGRVHVLPRVRAAHGRARRRPHRQRRIRLGVPADARRAERHRVPASKAAVNRFSEVLAASLAPQNVFVFSISPGLVRTAMTARFGEDAPWTPPIAPRLVHALATGSDKLAGRYLHAEHDPPEELRKRMDAILADDLNVVRLKRFEGLRLVVSNL